LAIEAVVSEHMFLKPQGIRMPLLWLGYTLPVGFFQGVEISVTAIAKKSAPNGTTHQPRVVFTTSSRLWFRFKGIIGRQRFCTTTCNKQSPGGIAGIADLFNPERGTQWESIE